MFLESSKGRVEKVILGSKTQKQPECLPHKGNPARPQLASSQGLASNSNKMTINVGENTQRTNGSTFTQPPLPPPSIFNATNPPSCLLRRLFPPFPWNKKIEMSAKMVSCRNKLKRPFERLGWKQKGLFVGVFQRFLTLILLQKHRDTKPYRDAHCRCYATSLEKNLASRREGVSLPRASGKSPDFPGSSPNFPGSFSATSPEVLSLWNFTAIQGFPGSFPNLPGSSPDFPRSFPDFPGGQPFLWEA